MSTINFPFGAPIGTLNGAPPTGNIFFVSSTHPNANTGQLGTSADRPLSTIDAAVGKCTADNGDVIYVLPGHTETVTAAGGLDLDVAGIRIVGLGDGRQRPVITFTTATTADVDIDAARITLENFRFTQGVDAVAACIDVNAADFTMRNCEAVLADGTYQAVKFIVTEAGADRMVVEGCTFRGSTDTGLDSAIRIVGTVDGCVIRNNNIYGDYADAPIHNPTSNVATNILIENNILQNLQTGDHAIELVSAVTGVIRNNIVRTDTMTVSIDPGSCVCQENTWYGTATDVGSGVIVPTGVGTVGHARTYIAKCVTGTMASGWGTAQSPKTVFTVTGEVLARVWVSSNTTVTSASNNGTLAFGTTDTTGRFVAAITCNGTNLTAGDVSGATATTVDSDPLLLTGNWVAINGADIIATIGTNDMTAGNLSIYCQWIPCGTDSSVVSAI